LNKAENEFGIKGIIEHILNNLKNREQLIEIAYFISETYAGKGYITEAVKAVSRWVLRSLLLDYLIAIAEIDNYPSQKVIQNCGFQKIETRMILNSGEKETKPFYYYRLYP
jgi:RimJ/RimL family protein N-acetyltransferase